MNPGTTPEPVIKLSERLMAIASMVKGGGTLCDVGCDHAHIPIYLIQTGRVQSVLGMDVIAGPLEKAQENLERYGCSDSVALRLSDGLDAYKIGEAQSLLISGMGGKIIRKILLREPEKTKSFKELILQPQLDVHLVRQTLRELDFQIDDETMLLDRGKYYTVLHAVPGVDQTEEITGPCADYFGPVLLRKQDLVLYCYLLWQKEVRSRIIRSLEQAGGSGERTEESLDAARFQLQIIEEALSYYETVTSAQT